MSDDDSNGSLDGAVHAAQVAAQEALARARMDELLLDALLRLQASNALPQGAQPVANPLPAPLPVPVPVPPPPQAGAPPPTVSQALLAALGGAGLPLSPTPSTVGLPPAVPAFGAAPLPVFGMAPPLPVKARMGPTLYSNLRENFPDAISYVRSLDMQLRSKHECRRMAQLIDQLLKEGTTVHHLSLEMCLRNLAGLQQADAFKDPSILMQFEWQPPRDIVPKEILRDAIKDAKRYQKYTRPPGGGHNGASTGGRG